MSSNYRKSLNQFQIGDTVYFDSSQDVDTMRITALDSSETTQGPDNLPFKQLNLRVEYLPINKWYDGRENDKISNSRYLVLHKDQRSNNKTEDKYYLHLEYRGFSTKIDIENNQLQILKPKPLYDSINTEPIKEIYFSMKDGLVGYKLTNGRIYTKREATSGNRR